MKYTLSYRSFPILIMNTILIAAFSIIIYGCAAQQSKVLHTQNPEDSLRAAAEQYWKLRMADKYEETYEMEDRILRPPFAIYRDQALAIKRITILKHEIDEVKVEDDAGTVKIYFFTMLPPVATPFKQVLYDKWIYREGAWRHILPPLD